MYPVSCSNGHPDIKYFIGQWMVKNTNLNILRMEHNFSMKQKKIGTCASDDTLGGTPTKPMKLLPFLSIWWV